MSTQTSITRLEECPTCHGGGFITVEMPKLFAPKMESYSKDNKYRVRVILAFILGTLVLSPALLGHHWEIFLK
jgi:hypothetical protein